MSRFDALSYALAAVFLLAGGFTVLGCALSELDNRLDGGVPVLRRLAGMEPK